MATFTGATKHSSTWGNQSVNVGVFSPEAKIDFTYYLNSEDSLRLTAENGVYLITEQAAPGRTYVNLAKS